MAPSYHYGKLWHILSETTLVKRDPGVVVSVDVGVGMTNFNPFPHDKNLNIIKIIVSVFDRIENIV